MTTAEMYERIKAAIDGAPRNAYVAELHLQTIKYSEQLKTTTGREFCESIGIGPSFATEFLKMKKISERLKDAGLDVNLI
jgi:hypothetical protein